MGWKKMPEVVLVASKPVVDPALFYRMEGMSAAKMNRH